MTDSRRDFIRTGAVSMVLGAAGCTTVLHNPVATPGPNHAMPLGAAGASEWDDSWFHRLAVPHKAVFEQVEADNGSATSYAVRYLNGVREALHPDPAAVRIVVVLRHSAAPFALDDEMWQKFNIGEDRKLKGPDGNWMARNPFRATRRREGIKPGEPEASLEWLLANGHIVLACNLSLTNNAGVWAKRANRDAAEVLDELKQHLIPGVILQPNGVYAVLRAQQAGCPAIRCP